MIDYVEKLRLDCHRSSTRQNYYQIWKSFEKFFLRLDIKPTSWEQRIVLFVGHLIETNHKSTTINSYISAIKAILWEDKIKVNQDRCLLKSLIRACRLKKDRMKTRIPIQKPLLSQILKQIAIIYHQQPYLTSLY